MAFKYFSAKFFYLSLIFVLILLFTACDRNRAGNPRHPMLLRANNLYAQGKYQEAIKIYKKYLVLHPKSAEANYKLAVIYQETEDYIPAIHYYEKFLSLSPNSGDKDVIEKWILSSRKKLYEKLDEQYAGDSEKKHENPAKTTHDVKAELDRLKANNDKLKDFILRHKKDLIAENKTAALPENNKPSIEKDFYYTVQAGDSLYKISTKFYGRPIYYRIILEANKNQLASPSKITIGQKLLIPVLKNKTENSQPASTPPKL